MESSIVPQNARKLWDILRAVYYVLLKSMSKHKLRLDFHLLFRRGKLAAKAVGGLLAAYPAHDRRSSAAAGAQLPDYLSALTCRSMDPSTTVYLPRAVEFSCRDTPLYSSYGFRGPRSHHHRGRRHHDRRLDNAYVTRLFELLDKEAVSDDELAPSVAEAGESPLVAWDDDDDPRSARQVRITDSPFPVTGEEQGKADGAVDRQAEEFISWFHEQLRLQQCRGAALQPGQYYWAR